MLGGRRAVLGAVGATAGALGLGLWASRDEVRAASKTLAVHSPLVDDVLATNCFLPKRQGPKWDPNWDLREPGSLVSPKEVSRVELSEGDEGVQRLLKSKSAKASRHIFLVRHGQYNLAGASDPEQKLTELGRAQAKETGRRLKELGFVFDRVVHSTMTRATETAQIIIEELDPKKVKSVKEEVMVEEGLPYPVEPPVPGLERVRVEELMREGSRIEAGFREYFHRAHPEQEKDSHELIVCHGNVSRYFLCRALQFPPEAWLRLTKAHASITHIQIRPNGRVILKSFADSGHLPPQLITYS